jgi:hypothetical protein
MVSASVQYTINTALAEHNPANIPGANLEGTATGDDKNLLIILSGDSEKSA